MRVAIFNVKYSPNLGDGVIAECLEHALRQRGGWVTWSIDLAGRERWSEARGGGNRALTLGLLRRMPGWLRDGGVGLALEYKVRTQLMKRWRRLLNGADAAVVGGGQLIQDADLNFPIKLAGAATACRSMNIPMAVFAVGATRCRSALGRKLLRSLLASERLLHAAARDEASCAVLSELGCNARQCCDPGLLACKVWAAPVRDNGRGRRPRVGLGITHPAVLAHHGGWRAGQSGDALSLYLMMAERLTAADFDVVCFTNGAAEDELFLSEIESRLRDVRRRDGEGVGGAASIARRCGTPGDLARLIASFDCVVAHRLHAAILAYSYRVPSVGLRWDEKLARFYQWTGRGGFAVPFDRDSARIIEGVVSEAMKRPIDRLAHEHVLAQTIAGIDCLIGDVDPGAGLPRDRRATRRPAAVDLSANPAQRRARPTTDGASLADEVAQWR